MQQCRDPGVAAPPTPHASPNTIWRKSVCAWQARCCSQASTLRWRRTCCILPRPPDRPGVAARPAVRMCTHRGGPNQIPRGDQAHWRSCRSGQDRDLPGSSPQLVARPVRLRCPAGWRHLRCCERLDRSRRAQGGAHNADMNVRRRLELRLGSCRANATSTGRHDRVVGCHTTWLHQALEEHWHRLLEKFLLVAHDSTSHPWQTEDRLC